MNNIPVNIDLFGALKDTTSGEKLLTVLENIGMGREEPITRNDLAALICEVMGSFQDVIEQQTEEKDNRIARLEDEVYDLDCKVDGLEDDDRDDQIADLEEEVSDLRKKNEIAKADLMKLRLAYAIATSGE